MNDRQPAYPDLERARAVLIGNLGKNPRIDTQVLDAMSRVPREQFIDAEYQRQAYEDNALPISRGQTISQPTVVAMMTTALAITPDDVVLEIGTGSGYQAAVIAMMAQQCITIERHPELAERAIENLSRAGISNVDVLVGDGSLGYPRLAPYDRILVTAATPSAPEVLLSQLRQREGCRLVAPIGDQAAQHLEVIEWSNGEWVVRRMGSVVRFVPLRGQAGWSDTEWSEP